MAALKRPRPASLLLVLAAILSVEGFFVCPAAAAGKTGQITIFWGRHADEGTLRQACDFNGVYTTVIVSYLNIYGYRKYRLDLSGHALAGVGDDIKHCQSLGIPVFLSIGGAYGLPTKQSAVDLADHLWYSYLGGSRDDVPRPFGNVQVNGMDLVLLAENYIDGGFDVLARELAKLDKRAVRAGVLPLTPRLTATPRCAFPQDGHVGRALATGLLERIHVRFYDYPNCTAAWIADAWDAWTAAYPASKIFLGLTASEKDACYLEPKAVSEMVMPIVQRADNYGGVVLWDRYSDEQNVNQYSSYLRNWA